MFVVFKRLFRTRPKTPYKLGQPTYETRPHYLTKPGYLTPGISAIEYYDRRLQLIKQLPKKSLTILVGNSVQYSSGSVFYDFQQDNNLFYMSGWLEPGSIGVLEKVDDKGTDEDMVFHMLVPDNDPYTEIWEGEKSGLQGCYNNFNPDSVEDVKNYKKYLTSLIKHHDYIFIDKQSSNDFNSFFSLHKDQTREDIHQLLKTHASGKTVKPINSVIAKMREVKSPSEIKVMHKAGQISSRAINKAVAKVGSSNPYMSEKSLAAYLDYEFIRSGCDKQAYIPVVAGGENALVIHYTRNDDLLYKDELVFVDAGGKLGGYCADISRAWPISGTFTEPQKDIYDVVLSVNKACIDQCYADNQMSLNDLHDFSVRKLHSNLKNLPGFAHVSRSEVTKNLYPHYIGHHLGLDLHDVPGVSKFTKLLPGNVVTIEPGLYIPKDDKWPKHYQGIGVRVEDDVAVGQTFKDSINLTSGCVKEVKDIEALISSGRCSTPGIYDELTDLHID
ncbi:aminopeptidase [Yamadazyma tenuis]|uniref:Aminopeptidase P N-terminal domain-containing protein n=1 Tax=Candida tenuis (strain ATCC 10573 / BCRC 21748 / CBS 615 / JCM 9827 / NBRC 10315 / NRRL Y-1498 / VKM Y-70) TaxID=590646 RepID=G3B814_CANTC|nr:uncharacterized protein CANTEDRAFT_107785 [Yamadazyma tenuis ATCC 10573]EGV62331.1 hypothetical protein CANTEDRAFT_107785 [Yamadazyma tenuis ATCC 10573]WEJ93591.1 aminopeptidase [Yamadazyma tenuis]